MSEFAVIAQITDELFDDEPARESYFRMIMQHSLRQQGFTPVSPVVAQYSWEGKEVYDEIMPDDTIAVRLTVDAEPLPEEPEEEPEF